MDSITRYLGDDHLRCDEFFIQAETSVGNDCWEQAAVNLNQFVQALERHFAMEEKVLFLAFEQAIGNSAGPTSVMRTEHRQMRAIVALLQEALKARDADAFLGHAETLNMMMRQHNLKEESILYLMADRVLSGRKDEIIGTMDDIDATT